MRRCLRLLLILLAVPALAYEWDLTKGEHFLIYHQGQAALASAIQRKAEGWYRAISADLGYDKRGDFWLWDRRVRITIYATAQEFATATSAPEWAGGSANYHRKEIATHAANGQFLDSVLPHEIAHLLLRDFIGFSDDIPLWLSEGFAQRSEPGGRLRAADFARQAKAGAPIIRLDSLTQLTTQQLSRDARFAALFYAEAAHLVDYMIRVHGGSRFTEFCRQLRDGKSLDRALSFAYPDRFRNIGELEQAWLKSLAGK